MDERSYVYDSLDRVKMVTFEDGKTMEYFYDFEGNVTRVVENASGTSKTTQFSYYGDNRLYQVTYVRASGNQVFTYDYDPGGRPEKLTYPASTGIVAEFEGPNNEPGWDGNGQLKHLCYKKGLDTIRRFAFEYDLAGNRISQLDVVDIAQPPTRRAVEWVYGYDWLDRLESVKKREATTVAGLALEPLQLTSMYQYDAADNRIEFKVPNLQQPELTELTETFTYGYDAADNILSISKAVGTGSANEIESFTSDDDGNLKTRTSGGVTTTYTWNDFNRLTAISTSDNSKKQSHTFGVNGFRRKKKDKNDVETTEYAAGLATAVSKAQAGDTITYLMGHRLMGFERESDGAMFWFVTDSLTTVRDVVDSSGEVKARYEFSEYGQRIASTENGVSSQKTFVGGMSVQDEVADTGLMMMGHRFYEPGLLGRFLNRDPIGFRGSMNLFEYAGSRPTFSIDPRGLYDSDPRLKIIGVDLDKILGEILSDLKNSSSPLVEGLAKVGVSPEELIARIKGKVLFYLDDSGTLRGAQTDVVGQPDGVQRFIVFLPIHANGWNACQQKNLVLHELVHTVHLHRLGEELRRLKPGESIDEFFLNRRVVHPKDTFLEVDKIYGSPDWINQSGYESEHDVIDDLNLTNLVTNATKGRLSDYKYGTGQTMP